MKVLCIDASRPKTPHLLKPEHWISEGCVYTVQSSYLDETDGHEYYYLVEKQYPRPAASYRANRFLPLSDKNNLIMKEKIREKLEQAI